MDEKRMSQIAAYAEVFSDPAFVFPGPCTDGAARHAEAAFAFLDLCYRDGWLQPGFDWPAWKDTDEARSLLDQNGHALEAASMAQIERLITMLVRQERFNEGTLHMAHRCGLLGRILARIAVLAR